MTLDFVIETPQRRGINRNNNKLIQKRATQAGARTRAKLQSAQKSRSTELGNPSQFCGDSICKTTCQRTPGDWLLANAGLITQADSPFVSHFGDCGRLFCSVNLIESAQPLTSPNPNISTLQFQLFTKLATSSSITPDANQAFKLFNLTHTHILQQLPSRYGHIAFLDRAIECLVARLHNYLPLVKSISYPKPNVTPSHLYGRALSSLRATLDQISDNQLPEIWFATLLLTLSELLAGDDEPGWIAHAAGAARLLYKIGPARICSEFQLSLLPIQCKNMVVETIITNKPCYLDDPAWQTALKRCILNSSSKFGLRSQCSIDLWCLGARIPCLFQLVADHVLEHPSRGDTTLRNALNRLLRGFDRWEDLWSSQLQSVLGKFLPNDSSHYDAIMILLAFFMLSMLAHRLRIALNPFESLHLEKRVLEMCTCVLQLRTTLLERFGDGMEQDLVASQFALGTMKTKDDWHKHVLNALPDRPIDALIFDEWCDAIGRNKQPFSFAKISALESTP